MGLMKRMVGKLEAIMSLGYGFAFRTCFAQCGKSFIPGFPLTVKGGSNIKIGNNFRGLGYGQLFANDGYMEIGNNVSINTNVQIGASQGRIVIGNDVLIGPNVVLRAADHGQSKSCLIREQPHRRGEIVVEDDVWIAANAVILRDVRLGRGCVVAAGAVVTSDVEPFAIVGGVPARKLSERI